MKRRMLISMLVILASMSAWAQQSKSLRLVVPFPAGGTADVLPRVMADRLRGYFPGGVVVENRSGAGGNIGAEFVYRSEPDGFTLMVSPPGPVAINHHLYRNLSFDPTRWAPVTVLATAPNVLAVSNRLGVSTLDEFMALARSRPEGISYASQGNGSTSHLTANLFMQLTGIRMVHIPYKGTAPALVDLVAGQVDVFFDNIGSSAPFHQSGKLRILAVADDKRSAVAPQVPTFAEQKMSGMSAVTFFSVMAPPSTPPDTLLRLQRVFSDVISQTDVRQKFEAQGADAAGWSVDQTMQFVSAESEKWKKVIQAAKVKVD